MTNQTQLFYSTIKSPLGVLTAVANLDSLCGLYLNRTGTPIPGEQTAPSEHRVLAQAKQQLDQYFAGSRKSFDLPLLFVGTEFQKTVWRGLLKIPHGETWSYKQLGECIGKPKAVRAIGLANGQNPLAIIAPCHRVIGSDGTLTGYNGGIEHKSFLLRHEGLEISYGAISLRSRVLERGRAVVAM